MSDMYDFGAAAALVGMGSVEYEERAAESVRALIDEDVWTVSDTTLALGLYQADSVDWLIPASDHSRAHVLWESAVALQAVIDRSLTFAGALLSGAAAIHSPAGRQVWSTCFRAFEGGTSPFVEAFEADHSHTQGLKGPKAEAMLRSIAVAVRDQIRVHDSRLGQRSALSLGWRVRRRRPAISTIIGDGRYEVRAGAAEAMLTVELSTQGLVQLTRREKTIVDLVVGGEARVVGDMTVVERIPPPCF